jgi:hypothetical protein
MHTKFNGSDAATTSGTRTLVELLGEREPSSEPKAPKQNPDDGESKEHKSQATILVDVAGPVDLFHDTDGEAYARFPVGEGDDLHWEVSRVRAKQFHRWLKHQFYRVTAKSPSAQALQDALGVIEAMGVYDGEQRQVFTRLAEHAGRIYIDLGNDRWQAVEIDHLGWRVIDNPPVMLRRAKAMLPLPQPDPHGDIQALRRFVNVTDEDWPLLLAWLVQALRPTGPYPVLAVHGEHGSAKSTLCRCIRKIIDPNQSLLRADYREPRDVAICANNGWIVALDNISSIRPWLSDCLCRLSTGGGFSTRTLFENDEETIFEAKRPVILNCIEDVVTRSDLLDRCMLLNLPRIEASKRVTEKQLDREFEAKIPCILGGLLTAVSAALCNEEHVMLPALPRMADFAIWATAAEPALGLQAGGFMTAYTANRAAGNDTAIETSPVGRALCEFVADVGEWSGTATDLLNELDNRAEEKTRKLDIWPKTAPALGGAVKRLAPNLREAGFGVEFRRTGRSRIIALTKKVEEISVTTVTLATGTDNLGVIEGVSVTQDGNDDALKVFSVTNTQQLHPEESRPSDASDGGDAEFSHWPQTGYSYEL